MVSRHEGPKSPKRYNVAHADAGEVIIIERRGQPVAELRACQEKKQPPLPDMTDFWNSMPKLKGDSGRFLEEDR